MCEFRVNALLALACVCTAVNGDAHEARWVGLALVVCVWRPMDCDCSDSSR